MANMFSENNEKKLPQSLNDCYKTDPITDNLWSWCEWLERIGLILFWVLIVIGIIDTVKSGYNTKQLIQEIGEEQIEELRKVGTEIPSVMQVIIEKLFTWAGYAFIEYCSYHVLALFIGSLATIVQNTKITANIALFNSINNESKEKKDIPEITGAKTKYIICENCGLTNAESKRFCSHCGESLSPLKSTIVNSSPEYKNKKMSKSTKCVCGTRYYGDICPNCDRRSDEC